MESCTTCYLTHLNKKPKKSNEIFKNLFKKGLRAALLVVLYPGAPTYVLPPRAGSLREDDGFARRSRNPGLATLVECRGMIERAKENWRRLKQSKPGRRFQDHHHRYQRGYGSRSYARGWFGLVWGLLILVGGVIAVPAPGPGWLIILLGLGIIAGESLSFARSIDRIEVSLRQLSRLVGGVWTGSPASGKVLLVALTVLAFVVALGYGCTA